MFALVIINKFMSYQIEFIKFSMFIFLLKYFSTFFESGSYDFDIWLYEEESSTDTGSTTFFDISVNESYFF